MTNGIKHWKIDYMQQCNKLNFQIHLTENSVFCENRSKPQPQKYINSYALFIHLF